MIDDGGVLGMPYGGVSMNRLAVKMIDDGGVLGMPYGGVSMNRLAVRTVLVPAARS
jgi:hypothetical protein